MSWHLLGEVLLVLGSLILVIAGVGVLRLPDALSRQHAATKAGTVGLVFTCAGAGLMAPASASWGWRLALIVLFALMTLPLASHLLARAALAESRPSEHQRARGAEHQSQP